jgi:hypothetical protein
MRRWIIAATLAVVSVLAGPGVGTAAAAPLPSSMAAIGDAQSVWAAAGICQSLLSLSNTSTQRTMVRDRNIAFNTVLGQECAEYASCRFDRNAVYHYAFSKSQVSKLDYFHPSLSGQAALASITWASSWWA